LTAVRRRWDVVAFFLASFILYAATAAPSVATVFDDSLEFHVVLPSLGIAHPSGYPFYTLLGKLATLVVPLRDPAGRANLLSALVAAIAVALLYLVARRFAGSRPAAAVAAAAFAVSPAWWSQATLAEVYALHGLLMMLFIYLLLRWEEARPRRPDRDGQGAGRQPGQAAASAPRSVAGFRSSGDDACLVASALVFGLGMAHHRLIALLAPAALLFIFWTDPGLLRSPRRWVWPIVAVLSPLLFYAYLPLRGLAVDSLDGAFVPTLAGTLNWIMARAYGVFLTGNPFGVRRDAAFFAGLFFQQFGALMVLSVGLGIVSGWRFSLRRYLFLLLATAPTVAFGASYKVQDIEVFFIPAFMLAALWAAIGLAPILDSTLVYAAGLGRAFHLPRGSRRLVLGGASLFVAIVVLAEPINAARRDWSRRDRSQAWGVYDYGRDMLANIAPGGRVVGLLGETTLLRYFRDVLGQRPDVTVQPADAEPDRFTAVDAALAAGAPVYLTRDLPGAAPRYSLDAAGPLIAVSPKASPSAPPPGRPIGAGVLLVDARTEVRAPRSGPTVRVTPTWAAAAPLRDPLKVSARLLDATGASIVQDDRAPVHFAYPTTAWVVGEPVRDSYDLALPPDAPSGAYTVLLILYRAADGVEVGRLHLPPIEVRR
jgi:hypothetical protein